MTRLSVKNTQKRRYEKAKREGRCPSCNSQPDPNLIYCGFCRKKQAIAYKKRKNKIREGIKKQETKK